MKLKFPFKFPPGWLSPRLRHRGRSVAARNARVNLVAAVGVVALMVGAIVYAVAISGGEARPEPEGRPRWWSAAQAQAGAEIYEVHCAECHGEAAAGAAENWREKTDDGTYPPPPLDGSAHAWHHDLGALRRVIRFGGKPGGGVMPAFGEKLGADQVDAVIAHFQSLWPEEIYRRWDIRERRRQ